MFKRLFAVAVVASCTLTACLFDDDKKAAKEESFTLTGRLADLDTLPKATPDSGGPTYDVWFLPVERSQLDEIEGDGCFYTGYLGDSAQTLYSNGLMAGNKTTEVFRAEGVELYRDTAVTEYTHYRVVFDCFD